MSQDTGQEHISKKAVVYRIPGMEEVEVRGEVEYGGDGAGALTLDIYYPPASSRGALLPAVLFVTGYSDVGAEAFLGCKLKEMAAYVSWGRLAAASGLIGVTYSTREPASDVPALLRYLRRNAATLGMDEQRLGLWACSGNVPLALWLLMEEARQEARCAVLCYGYMLDLEGSDAAAEAARTYGFANPCAGRSVEDLPPDVPLLVVRAGQDQLPRLNETIDRFVPAALKRNLPLTLVNHPAAPHAFDLFDDGETSRDIIAEILAFLRRHLLAERAVRGSTSESSGGGP